jgi:uncharacterized membrane protein YbaN (DUF454 family)
LPVLNPRARKLIDWCAGLALLAVGLTGFLLPVFPGWPFVFAGLAVLSSHSRWARSLHERCVRMGRSVRDKVRSRKDGGADGLS